MIVITLQNLDGHAAALVPRAGRGPALNIDFSTLRALLQNFAALPPFEAEDANSRINITTSTHRLVVRHAGGRLIYEENGDFSTATVDDILSRLFGKAPSIAPAQEAIVDPSSVTSPTKRTFTWSAPTLLILSAIIVVVGLGVHAPTPSTIEWLLGGKEREALVESIAGSYTREDALLNIDATSGKLIVSDKEGQEVLRTSLLVGRQGGKLVLKTDAGVVLQPTPEGALRLGDAVYQRSGSMQ